MASKETSLKVNFSRWTVGDLIKKWEISGSIMPKKSSGWLTKLMACILLRSLKKWTHDLTSKELANEIKQHFDSNIHTVQWILIKFGYRPKMKPKTCFLQLRWRIKDCNRPVIIKISPLKTGKKSYELMSQELSCLIKDEVSKIFWRCFNQK